MRTIVDIVTALFVSDGVLGFAILGVVAATSVLLKATALNVVAELVLVGGCLAALGFSVSRGS